MPAAVIRATRPMAPSRAPERGAPARASNHSKPMATTSNEKNAMNTTIRFQTRTCAKPATLSSSANPDTVATGSATSVRDGAVVEQCTTVVERPVVSAPDAVREAPPEQHEEPRRTDEAELLAGLAGDRGVGARLLLGAAQRLDVVVRHGQQEL